MDPSGGEGATPSADEIADALTSRGEYVLRMTPRPHQDVVDLHWQAHRAARLLGIKVRVIVHGPVRDVDPYVTVLIRPRRSELQRLSG